MLPLSNLNRLCDCRQALTTDWRTKFGRDAPQVVRFVVLLLQIGSNIFCYDRHTNTHIEREKGDSLINIAINLSTVECLAPVGPCEYVYVLKKWEVMGFCQVGCDSKIEKRRESEKSIIESEGRKISESKQIR